MRYFLIFLATLTLALKNTEKIEPREKKTSKEKGLKTSTFGVVYDSPEKAEGETVEVYCRQYEKGVTYLYFMKQNTIESAMKKITVVQMWGGGSFNQIENQFKGRVSHEYADMQISDSVKYTIKELNLNDDGFYFCNSQQVGKI
jgi:hypothetical protein